MSQYGHPPQSGQHPDQGWSQPAHPYGGQGYGQGYGQPQGYPQPGGGYATWGQRVLATLWEMVVVLPGLALLFVGTLVLGVGGAMSSGDGGGGLGTALVVIGVLLVIAGYGWALWRPTSGSTRAAPATPTEAQVRSAYPGAGRPADGRRRRGGPLGCCTASSTAA